MKRNKRKKERRKVKETRRNRQRARKPRKNSTANQEKSSKDFIMARKTNSGCLWYVFEKDVCSMYSHRSR